MMNSFRTSFARRVPHATSHAALATPHHALRVAARNEAQNLKTPGKALLPSFVAVCQISQSAQITTAKCIDETNDYDRTDLLQPPPSSAQDLKIYKQLRWEGTQ